jgi:hypothetical protein
MTAKTPRAARDLSKKLSLKIMLGVLAVSSV